VAQVLNAVRSGDRAAASRPATPGATLTPSGAMLALREAVEAGATVLIDYVDNHGSRSQRLVDPRRVEGGWLTAHDHRSDDDRTFAVHRITAVKPVDPGP
jgi:predicted DNA-binding transcriptional regulator YafY